jgi:hypothetical protein
MGQRLRSSQKALKREPSSNPQAPAGQPAGKTSGAELRFLLPLAGSDWFLLKVSTQTLMLARCLPRDRPAIDR